MRKPYFALLIFCAAISLTACKKKNSDFTSAKLADFYPSVVGKYITYNLDSTIYINFGTKDTVIKYQVQDRVDAQVVDNLGRPAYRIIRYIRKNATQGWTGNNTFMIIPTTGTIEFVENNLRYQKLKLPITEGFSWKGNSFIDTYSLSSDVKYLDDWNYEYTNVNGKTPLGSVVIDSTVTIKQRDEFLGQSPTLPGTQYAEKNYSTEIYAKNIGLIYKEFLHWEYQGPQPGRVAYYVGYGVKLTMIGHN